MDNKLKKHTWLVFFPVLFGALILSGCTAKTANIWGDPETGLILLYQMPEGQTLTYESTSELLQTLDVMGQIQEVEGETSSSITFESKGKKDNNFQIKTTINAMDMYYASAQGDLTPDTSEAVGKSFDIIMSPSGKELELLGIEEVKIDMGPDGIRDLSSDFQDSFPDMAENPVKIGDSWTTTLPVKQTSTTGESTLFFTNTYTLEGFETVEGYECVRIKTETKGTYEGTSEQGGMELLSEGEIVGTGTLYFAYKKGIYVKMTGQGTAEGYITVSAQGLEIPLTREFKSESKLVK
ncbi:MAG: hypothetical protein PVF22_02945 [Candidatus Aminicenantes bacterium]|jgi:hypothetical protein